MRDEAAIGDATMRAMEQEFQHARLLGDPVLQSDNSTDLSSLLRGWATQETLDGDNAFFCEHCATHAQDTSLEEGPEAEGSESEGNEAEAVLDGLKRNVSFYLGKNASASVEAIATREEDDDELPVKQQLHRTKARKQCRLTQAPRVLTITIKRFMHDEEGRSWKVGNQVQFEEVLEVGAIQDTGNMRYQLTGVVEHQGGMGGGHYVAYVRSGDGRWWYISDDCVSESSSEAARTSQAYILWYEQVDQH